MPPTDIQRRMLRRVVAKFLNSGESTPRQDLAIEFRDVRSIDDLVSRQILKTIDHDEYLPTALAFHYCGSAEVEDRARHAIQVLAQVFQTQFLTKATKFTREGLEEDASKIDPAADLRLVELALYLAPEFNLLASWVGGDKKQPIITPTRIDERIVEIKHPDSLWDDVMRQRSHWPGLDVSDDAIALVPPSEIKRAEPAPATQSDKWSRGDKIALASFVVAVVGVLIALLFPEVRVWLHLQKPEPTSTSVQQPSDLPPQKEKAVVEVAGFDSTIKPSSETEVWEMIYARNTGPGIARNVKAIVLVYPALWVHDQLQDEFLQDFGFSRMLKAFSEEPERNSSEGPSLAAGQTQTFVGKSPPLKRKGLEDWKLRKNCLYLMGEVTWSDDYGEWKTDVCKDLLMPQKVDANSGVGVTGNCYRHNGIRELYVQKP